MPLILDGIFCVACGREGREEDERWDHLSTVPYHPDCLRRERDWNREQRHARELLVLSESASYGSRYLGTLDLEIAALARDQMNDDQARADTQRLGGHRVLSLNDWDVNDESADPWLLDEDADPSLIYERNQDEEESFERHEWVTQTVRALSPALQEAYAMVMIERMSEEQAAMELNISQPAVHYRLERVKQAIKAEAEELRLYA